VVRTGSGTPPGIDDLRAFLERELPPASTKDASYIAKCLLKAAARYDRYAARRNDWLNYTRRRGRFARIAALAEALASDLAELDSLSRDDLDLRFDAEKLSKLTASLLVLRNEAEHLANAIQKSGRPRDVAEERWILEVADIFQNAFSQPPRVWGSGAGPARRRGKFYHLLELCRPPSFPRYGKLSPKQIDRVIKGRRRRSRVLFLQAP